jgi:catechol 2,3-dioxygenase-like lactoylglutathione lyase family enzyme
MPNTSLKGSADEVRSALGIRHVAIAVHDLERALRFYRDVMGFADYHVGDRDWAMLKREGTGLSLIAIPRDKPVGAGGRGSHPAHFGVSFGSPAEVDAFRARLEKQGIGPLGVTKRHRDGSYGFYLTDSEGNPLECIFIPYVSAADPRLAAGEVAVAVAWGEPPSAASAHFGGVPVVRAELAELERLAREYPKLKLIHLIPLAATGEIDTLVAQARARWPHIRFDVGAPALTRAAVREGLLAAIATQLTEAPRA